MKGTFIAAFTGATVLFVGVPLVQTMYGSNGIPYLLVYFFANCVFIWTVGIFNIQLDGARRGMTEEPKIFSVRGLKMLLSPPLMGFLIGLIVVLLSIPVPKFIAQSIPYNRSLAITASIVLSVLPSGKSVLRSSGNSQGKFG